jgi:hypothetical protein
MAFYLLAAGTALMASYYNYQQQDKVQGEPKKEQYNQKEQLKRKDPQKLKSEQLPMIYPVPDSSEFVSEIIYMINDCIVLYNNESYKFYHKGLYWFHNKLSEIDKNLVRSIEESGYYLVEESEKPNRIVTTMYHGLSDKWYSDQMNREIKMYSKYINTNNGPIELPIVITKNNVTDPEYHFHIEEFNKVITEYNTSPRYLHGCIIHKYNSSLTEIDKDIKDSLLAHGYVLLNSNINNDRLTEVYHPLLEDFNKRIKNNK